MLHSMVFECKCLPFSLPGSSLSLFHLASPFLSFSSHLSLPLFLLPFSPPFLFPPCLCFCSVNFVPPLPPSLGMCLCRHSLFLFCQYWLLQTAVYWYSAAETNFSIHQTSFCHQYHLLLAFEIYFSFSPTDSVSIRFWFNCVPNRQKVCAHMVIHCTTCLIPVLLFSFSCDASSLVYSSFRLWFACFAS